MNVVSENLVWSRKQILSFHCHTNLGVCFCHSSEVLILVPCVDKNGKLGEEDRIRTQQFLVSFLSSLLYYFMSILCAVICL